MQLKSRLFSHRFSRGVGLSAAGLASLALAACVPSAPEPTPAPRPAPSPSRAPVTQDVPTPTYDNWMDAPQAPGDWSYRPGAGGGTALFGEPQSEARLMLRCDRAAGTVAIVRSGRAAAALPMRIRAETLDRVVDARPTGTEQPTITATLPARDKLLDAIAFSRGRFAVEVAGLPPLYVPAWPEITRVVEDCR
ncbi:conserved hypothetical protein [Altererythrobacter sp. B11]|uniref:hypothetical protein n=1 Tax=Altererythrobacter sp. B11 TaxID=2060312 RepID=UPI000DC6FE88|nr:hypothetical protein [Altererythrobacter sp. B11]BBC72374.1 conserved hypothetical protein [Altererythrobacter sp. B11]